MRLPWLGLVVLLACGGNSRGTPDAAGGGDDGGGEGSICGGLFPRPCSATEYCDFPDNSCGIADGAGTCKPRPVACPAVVGPPICGCDGKVRSGECPTYVTGSDLSAHGGCPLDSTRFECGYTQCELATQYCRREPHRDGAETFSCLPLPACTGAPSCACLGNERCGSACAGDAKAGLTLSCPPTP
jgi:hypothetical protein